jgi:hypothetical protein
LTHQLHQQFAGLHADGFRQGAHGDGKGDRHLALAWLRAFQALWFAAGAAARAGRPRPAPDQRLRGWPRRSRRCPR